MERLQEFVNHSGDVESWRNMQCGMADRMHGDPTISLQTGNKELS